MMSDPYEHLADWYDAMYAAMGIKPLAYQPALVSSLLQLFDELGVQSVLDCACGTGDPIIGLVKQSSHLSVVGTDGSAKMLARCALNAMQEGVISTSQAIHTTIEQPILELAHVKWDTLEQFFPNRRFDFVMCRGHAIYHLHSREAIIALLRSMKNLAEPGGYVLADMICWSHDLRGEVGREEVKFRGWLKPDHHLNPLNHRVLFLDTCHYHEDATAVCGIVQTKTLHVLAEVNYDLTPIDTISVQGAPFSVSDLALMMETAGLQDVQEVNLGTSRYKCVLGRKASNTDLL